MILCWGYSIHADRRIRIFTEDPTFEVTIVSTYPYHIPNSRLILLAGNLPGLGKGWFPQLNRSQQQPPRIVSVMRGILSRAIFVAHHLAIPLVALIDLATLRRAVRKIRPQVILLQTLMYPCYLAYFLPRNIPQVVTFWNGDVTWWAKWNGIEMLLKKQIVTYGARRAAAITVNSELARQATINYGVSPERIHLIGYPGVDLQQFHPQDPVAVREALGIAQRPVILWPRGLGGYLNSEVLMVAALTTIRQYPNALFVLLSEVGGERELLRHQRWAARLGIENNFLWKGHVPSAEMPLYYAAADVMISLSSNDSRPNVMLEAMACGTPVIMSDLPQIREWVTDGYNGYLVNPRHPAAIAQAIGRLLSPEQQKLRQLFAQRNLELIGQRASLADNLIAIRKLIHTTAQANNKA